MTPPLLLLLLLLLLLPPPPPLLLRCNYGRSSSNIRIILFHNNNNNNVAATAVAAAGEASTNKNQQHLILRRQDADDVIDDYKVGVNWGVQASHQLAPKTVVKMAMGSNIGRVKLFDADHHILRALVGSGMEVMLGIPNRLLHSLATCPSSAAAWLRSYVLSYVFHGGVHIKYVAVGNEPFLRSYNGSFVQTTLPALQNVQKALNAAGLGDRIKTTVPCNADVLSEDNERPSQGRFRQDIALEMEAILEFLHQNGCPFTVNIYPFLSLYADYTNFPLGYAFFDGGGARITDGDLTYTNVFDASYDTMVAAMENSGFGDVRLIVGEIGWPSDGFVAATPANAQRFNQGFLDHVRQQRGTPRRPNTTIHFYLFSLLDEDQKSIDPGNFERHWGIFAYDGAAKYPLMATTTSAAASAATIHRSGTTAPPPKTTTTTLVNAEGVRYLPRRWCILANFDDIINVMPAVSTSSDSAADKKEDHMNTANSSSTNVQKKLLDESVAYACAHSDCTALATGSSCGGGGGGPNPNPKMAASYAFNMYFQTKNQEEGSCYFHGLASITYADPSAASCRFIVQLATSAAAAAAAAPGDAIAAAIGIHCLLAYVALVPWILPIYKPSSFWLGLD